MHVIGVFQGLLLAILLLFGENTSTASRILGAWCLFLALTFLGPFIHLDREINVFSPLIGLHIFLPASFGAFLYLYCRHAIIERHFVLKDLWHFLPFVLCYLLNIELYLSSPEVKLDAILYGPKNLTLMMFSQMILAIQAIVYLGLSMVMVRRFQKKANQTLSSFNPEMFSWLWRLLLLDLFIWFLKAISVLSEHAFIFDTAGDVLIIVLIYSIALAQWRDPMLFKVLQLKISNNAQQTLSSPETLPKTVAACETTLTDDGGALDPKTRSELLKVVRQHMQEHKVYLDNQLTLSRLAETVGLSNHHLSEVLNQHEGNNFYHFVNEYRINYICERLKHDHEVKFLDLAMSAGFSSKSTFNAVFKQFVKLTPTQYRKQLSQ